MRLQSWILTTALLSASVCAAPLCGEQKTDFAMTQCLSAHIGDANRKLDKYLSAARLRMGTQIPDEKVDLAPAQALWRSYVHQQCGDVYRFWVKGTIRYEKSAHCQLDLVQERTHDIWSSYLTYADSTPPDLPEP